VSRDLALDASSMAALSERLDGLDRHVIPQVSDERRAAVLISLCTLSGAPSFLFTTRTETVSTHKGHVSFPGGMVDPEDDGPVHTALRELHEELGLSANSVEVLGLMHDVRAITGVPVTPVVGFLGELGDLSILQPQPEEIADVFALGFDQILDPEGSTLVTYGSRGPYPVFNAGPAPVWGLTAWILAVFMREGMGLDVFAEVKR
jgi:8-oxo-dGTP pyrophosphatase MutT (NUDIX family)